MSFLQLGFLTNALFHAGVQDPVRVAGFAQENGFSSVEVGPTFEINEKLIRTFTDRGVKISDFIYCRNLLTEDRETQKKHIEEVRKRIELAQNYEVPMVTLSSGILSTPQRDVYDRYEAIRPLPEDSLEEFVKIYSPLVELAEKKRVRLAIENCPLMGNWAISPYLWEKMFERLDSSYFGLTYDPSHLLWQFIDPFEPLRTFRDRIFMIHAKDTEIDRKILKQKGILSDFSWWRYRIPGWGVLNWQEFISTLREIDFQGPITIEHEDPVYSGSEEMVKRGILLAQGYLKSFEKTCLRKF